ncbi:MIP/aquaporin family protein [Sporolactobacillus pectinivorans]|uniref:MIP/aquaporin family protein n=1 Tax=Sporolactobacillus pectinivorans TaxID=1591408 RepID=UPI000C25F50E|nr:MIP/aquaporin family protein [Sporolactobacillus pectinivorans]
MEAFLGELAGTFIMVLLGDGAVANVILKKSKAENSGWIVITAGWAFAVAIPVWIFGSVSGAHFNPAVTLGLACIGKFPWSSAAAYMTAQFIGAFLAAVVLFLHFYKHFEATTDPATKLGVFSTGPAIRSKFFNFFGEFINTFVLLFGIVGIVSQKMAPGLMGLAIGILIFAIGLSLGGTTGYAINPARDLAPRIAHALLPIPGKGGSDWAYAWIPVVGPILGGICGAFAYVLLFH